MCPLSWPASPPTLPRKPIQSLASFPPLPLLSPLFASPRNRTAMDAPERRWSNASSSPEFEFWPVDANPAASPSCADELFADGVLLPLPIQLPKVAPDSHNCTTPELEPEPEPEPEQEDATVAATSAAITSPAPPAVAGGSKRWTDIFAKKPAEEKEKRKDGAGGRKPAASTGGGGGGGGSELNINIWPFSRSRSAGGGGVSSKPRPLPRKASSAPCSRSNSRGEAAVAAPPPPRRWAASPGRAGGGVPVGRSSPVWQIKRPAAKHTPADQPTDRRAHQKDKPAGVGAGKKAGAGGGGMRGINLSVNSCIGYRHQVSCRRLDAGGGARSPGDGGSGLFGIKGFFSKKVH